jgi:hypothetical protein
MIGISTFLPLSESAAGTVIGNCFLSLNVRVRRLELRFDLIFPGNRSEEYKITLPLAHLTPGSFTVNRLRPSPNLHSVFFESLIAPQVWKRSPEIDEEDLKDRLYWTEHEQWMRQCEILPDPLDPSFQVSDTRIIIRNSVLQTGLFIFLTTEVTSNPT